MSWEFLDAVLELKAFDRSLRRWIKGCLRNTNFSILINRRSRDKIRDSRGLRHGDPFSPFLFTITGDVRSRMVPFCLEKRILKGIMVGKDKVEVFVLQCADDTIVFYPNETSVLTRWWEMLNVFIVESSVSLNLAKTSLIGINISVEEVAVWAYRFGCQADSLPINYFGFPLG